MAQPAEIDITVDRNVIFDDPFTFLDLDLTGSSFQIQWRLVKDTTGTPLAEGTDPDTLGLLYAGSTTVSAHVSAGRLLGVGSGSIYTLTNPATGNLYQPTDTLLLSQVYTFFDGSLFPFPAERGDDLQCWYDIIRTPSGGDPAELLMRGEFIVRAGVTIP